jgi:hypothetical protein
VTPHPAIRHRACIGDGLTGLADHSHRPAIVTVVPEDNTFRLVIDGDTVATVPRTTSRAEP